MAALFLPATGNDRVAAGKAAFQHILAHDPRNEREFILAAATLAGEPQPSPTTRPSDDQARESAPRAAFDPLDHAAELFQDATPELIEKAQRMTAVRITRLRQPWCRRHPSGPADSGAIRR